MLFNSIEFFFFLPIVFCLYWFVFRKLMWQNLFLIVASYIFYGWWDWKFLILIAFSSVCSYVFGNLIKKEQQNKNKYAKLYLTLNITINLVLLGIFKYYNFFVSSFVDAIGIFGYDLNVRTLHLILPIGISFYTFQALSYTIDIYKKKIEPATNPIEFFAFISFFPQLVAGPIERATNLLPQIQKPRVFTYEMAADGTRQILWGLFKKMVVADNCAIIVNNIFGNYQHEDGLTLAFAAILFTFQIYGDFSGYSDIAIGTGRLFGINLMQNFRFPFFSKTVAEFWRRWHISLNSWFIDYVYIPLGGGRVGKWKKVRNTMIVFLTSGLWHGANWTYIAWGALYGFLLIPSTLKGKKAQETSVDLSIVGRLKDQARILWTFSTFLFGLIIFRSNTIYDAFLFYKRMLFDMSFTLPDIDYTAFIYIFILMRMEWINRDKQFGLQIDTAKWHPAVRYSIYILLMFAILILSGKSTQFIYFQF